MNHFWQRPPRWVWILLGTALGLFGVSMLTLREGLRFASRPLQKGERVLVGQALEQWERLDPSGLRLQNAVRALLRQNLLRAMDEDSFGREAERSTLGYTDEQGRILLNPRICFAAWHCLGRIEPCDLVRTASTLVHESQHYLNEADESEACRAELEFVRQAWLKTEDTAMAQEWKLWERDLLERTAGVLDSGRGPVLLPPPRRETATPAGMPGP